MTMILCAWFDHLEKDFFLYLKFSLNSFAVKTCCPLAENDKETLDSTYVKFLRLYE